MSSNDIAAELQRLLAEYNEEVTETAERVGKEIAEEAVDELKATSPKHRPEYALGWDVKKTESSKAGSSYAVYNRTHPGLTHILEKGHVIVNQSGSTGKRVKARRHIRPVETKYNEKYYEKIVEEVNGIK